MQDLIKNEKFLIIKSIKIYILSLEKLLINFPKKDIFTRNMVYQDALDLLELVYKANYESRKEIKQNYQIGALAKVNRIDFYLERAYRFGYISEKQCINVTKRLEELNKMLYRWCNGGWWFKGF